MEITRESQRPPNDTSHDISQPSRPQEHPPLQQADQHIADKNHIQNIGQGNQQAMGSGQSANATNRPVGKQAPLALVLPVVEPHLDKDRATLLQGLYAELMSNNATVEEFTRHMRNLVGDRLVTMAVNELQQGQSAGNSTLASESNAKTPPKKTSVGEQKTSNLSLSFPGKVAKLGREFPGLSTKQINDIALNHKEAKDEEKDEAHDQEKMPIKSVMRKESTSGWKTRKKVHVSAKEVCIPSNEASKESAAIGVSGKGKGVQGVGGEGSTYGGQDELSRYERILERSENLYARVHQHGEKIELENENIQKLESKIQKLKEEVVDENRKRLVKEKMRFTKEMEVMVNKLAVVEAEKEKIEGNSIVRIAELKKDKQRYASEFLALKKSQEKERVTHEVALIKMQEKFDYVCKLCQDTSARLETVSKERKWLIEEGFIFVLKKLLKSEEFLRPLGEMQTAIWDAGMHVGLVAGYHECGEGKVVTESDFFMPNSVKKLDAASAAFDNADFPYLDAIASCTNKSIDELRAIEPYKTPSVVDAGNSSTRLKGDEDGEKE